MIYPVQIVIFLVVVPEQQQQQQQQQTAYFYMKLIWIYEFVVKIHFPLIDIGYGGEVQVKSIIISHSL